MDSGSVEKGREKSPVGQRYERLNLLIIILLTEFQAWSRVPQIPDVKIKHVMCNFRGEMQ